jgi:hypothetical protein
MNTREKFETWWVRLALGRNTPQWYTHDGRAGAMAGWQAARAEEPRAVVPEWFDPHSAPPAHYQPVVGYHPEWIDSSNHAGVRECFTTGYGNVWLNSAWLEGADSYQTGKMVPLLWTHMPAPPKQEQTS